MSDEWGPWIDHDGRGVPVMVGQMYQAEYADGDEETAIHGVNGHLRSGDEWEKDNGSWLWLEDYEPIIRYRIRKPRGLTMLQELIENLPADGRVKDGELA